MESDNSENNLIKSDKLSLTDLCKIINISLATGKNWIKLNKIKVSFYENKTPFFTSEYVNSLKEELLSGKNPSLRSRRNKQFVSGIFFYKSYVSQNNPNIVTVTKLLQKLYDLNLNLSLKELQYLIGDCFLHLYFQKNCSNYANQNHLLEKVLSGSIKISEQNNLFYSLFEDFPSCIEFCKKYPILFENQYIYEVNEDLLGLIYISCKNMRERKANGSYYTPTKIVKTLISKLNFNHNDKILDPCCGTGNFLLQLPENVSFDQIFGNDLDSISIKIARLNMNLKFPEISEEIIINHITNKNYLFDEFNEKFDFIIGNPPWGFNFSIEETAKLKEFYSSAKGNKIESFDVIIERTLKNLSLNGKLAFVVPEAFLTVKSHFPARTLLLNSTSINYLEFLGNVFNGIHCPAINLILTKNNKILSTIGTEIKTKDTNFIIKTERNLTAENFCFSSTDEEFLILNKIKNHKNSLYLKNNCDFALGIVTGNNEKFLSHRKGKNSEIIIKGSDISKFHIKKGNNYINFQKDQFQQSADEKIYRAPEKLFYKFISSKLIFAYDNEKLLSLNSCNILIPKFNEIPIKFVLGILNSSVAQFLFQLEFNSIKILRSHIEKIPIPVLSEKEYKKVICLVDQLINSTNKENFTQAYDELDNLIFEFFDISKEEQSIIKNRIIK